MCLSIPSRVVSIDKAKSSAMLDTMGVRREASLDLMGEGSVQEGDYVLVHIGFVINKIDEAAALASLEAYEEVLRIMGDEEES